MLELFFSYFRTDKNLVMIPKKIHYCWLSGETIPSKLKDCINTWSQILPDYELICWDKSRFDITSEPFVFEACEAKKWAFAADYIRLHALFTEGGIYLDSDVIVKKSLNGFLDCEFFSSIEIHDFIVKGSNSLALVDAEGNIKPGRSEIGIPGIGMQAAVIGSVKGHTFLADCLNWYRGRHFILSDGNYYDKIIAPAILSSMAEKYGFRYKDERQELKNNMIILPSEVFSGTLQDATANAYAIHLCDGSWRDKKVKPTLLARISNKLMWWKSKNTL